jgi:hypothetical protein
VPAGYRETSSRVSRPQLLFRQDTSSLRTPSALIFASVEGVPSQCCAVMFIVRGKPNADDAPMRFKRPALELDIPVGNKTENQLAGNRSRRRLEPCVLH